MPHIALSHTPFHLLQIGLLAEQLAQQGERMIVFHEGAPDRSIPGLDQTEMFELPGYRGYKDGRRVAPENITRILRDPRWHKDATLYASDLRWLTNNAVYFSLPRHVRLRTVLFADGLGSYLHRTDTRRTTLISWIKSAAAIPRLGPTHHPLRGHHLGLDSRYVSRAVGFKPELLRGNVAKEELPTPSHSSKASTPDDVTMIVGAPMNAPNFSKSAALSVIDQTTATAAAHSGPHSRFLYKPHHFEDRWIRHEYRSRGFEPIESGRPLELLIRDINVNRIFAAFSSALAFGTHYSGGSCKSYSVAFDAVATRYLNHADAAELRRVLRLFGVRFV